MNITFVYQSAEEKNVEAQVGQTLLEVMNEHKIPILNICSGAGVCGSCKVKIAPGFEGKILPPKDQELDILEMFQMDNDVRLACQISLTHACDGLRVILMD